ncbi:MAG: hypothetical protein GY854_23490 [Deltaproteobacteria bacterium]|nr:hypothetical protein [Deltaproteobacteria bacterium]
MIRNENFHVVFLFCAVFAVAVGCNDDNDDDNGLEETGESCQTAEECYDGFERDAFTGDIVCMDRVENGYCTHHCVNDDDCCAIPGECKTSRPQVCGPFESTGEKFCFLSCENLDAGVEENYCQLYAHPNFICRSTGGGSENRKVCVPNG